MRGEIIRNGNTQIVKNLINNTESVEIVEWISDCNTQCAEKKNLIQSR
jgi:hypothetical protein